MSGDVQPRKRKDKKRKKDELGIEEPRGTAAALGEGDVFMHTGHDHGTGGHWCAKVIFFSLLAILVILIGLIILENRGLSELEANSVESRYSGVLEGWLEDAPDDDHHDEHTLELNHHDNDDEGHDENAVDDEHNEEEDEVTDDDEHGDDDHDDNEDDEHLEQEDEDEDDDDEGDDDEGSPRSIEDDEDQDDDADNYENDDDDQLENDDSQEQDLENDEDDDDEPNRETYQEDEEDDADENADLQEADENDEEDDSLGNDEHEDDDENNSNEIYKNEFDEESEENERQDEDDNEHEEEEEDDHDEEVEVEKLEKEIEGLEPVSTELPALPEEDDDDDDKDEDQSDEKEPEEQEDSGIEDEDEAEEFLEMDDADEPPVEKITVPAGKPFDEVEEEVSSEQPPDTLEEEEEYEKRQEELRREEAQASHKDGGNSIDDLWPGEPSDAYWRQQLDSAEEELRQGSWSAAATRAGAADLRGSGRARFVLAKALDLAAEAQRDNRLLTRAIAAYLDLLKMNDQLSDKKLLQVSARALDRIQFRGTYLSAEPVYRLLIRRFPNEPAYRNNLTISFLMANRVDLAEETLKETLQRWPKDRVALAHYAFVLKTKHNKYEEAAELFKQALEGDTGPANEPRFYYHYGDSLLLLGRPDEAHEVHKRGAKLGHFLSPSQRSLYNVDRLKSTPWWDVEKTPYLRLAKALEKSWKEILKEGEAARALYEKEKEGLKERGDWSQLDLFVRGQELPDRCARAPVTCSVVKSEPAAAGCRRGQVKFSLMAPGTHVRAHVGPTNCRLRMHLGLSNTKDTYIRVDKEIRQWQVGKVLMFDDSFEHEVWHNGTGARLVLIVDVWHPHLTAHERRQLPAI